MGWDHVARRRWKLFWLPLSREWDPEVTFLSSPRDGNKRVHMRPTWDGNGTGIATCAGWEWELLGSIWNGNLKQRGIGMGNDGVDTEWEREWER